MRVAEPLLAVMSLRARIHDLRDDWPLTLLGLSLLVAATVYVSRRRSAAPWLVFIVAALFWLAVNGAAEGPTLVHVVRRHGMTLGDLLPVLLAILAAGVALRRRVRSAAPRGC